MLVYLAPRRYRHEEFLFCQGCRQWIPKPWDGWAPQCDLCGELYETTRFVYVAGGGTRIGVRGWYPKDIWSTPPAPPPGVSDVRAVPGAHYRDVTFVEEAPKPPASRWKYVVSSVLAVGVVLASYVLSH